MASSDTYSTFSPLHLKGQSAWPISLAPLFSWDGVKLLLLYLFSFPFLRPLNRQRSRTTDPNPKHTSLFPLQYRRSTCRRQSLSCKSQLGGMCFPRMPSSSGPAQRVSIDYRRYQRLRLLKSILRSTVRGLLHQHNRSRSSVLETAEDLCGLLTPAPFGFCSSTSEVPSKPSPDSLHPFHRALSLYPP